MKNFAHSASAQSAGPGDPIKIQLKNFAVSALEAAAVTMERGARHYDRARILPRLIAAGPAEIGGAGLAADAHILQLLAKELRRERTLGRAGHWAYDLNRHIGLSQAYLAEKARMPAAPGQGRQQMG